MKKLFFLSLLFSFTMLFLVGCKSTPYNTNNIIPYLLPIETERTIFNEMNYISPEKKIAFYFNFSNSGRIDIWADTFSNEYSQTVKLSNRKIFINDTFYPLIFSLDQTFQANLKDGNIVVEKNCYYHKSDRKEVITTITIPTLLEREKLFPYIDGEPCQISQRRTTSMRHQGYLLTIDFKGNIIEIEKRPDRLKKID